MSIVTKSKLILNYIYIYSFNAELEKDKLRAEDKLWKTGRK